MKSLAPLLCIAALPVIFLVVWLLIASQPGELLVGFGLGILAGVAVTCARFAWRPKPASDRRDSFLR
jgi:hypothetical protein